MILSISAPIARWIRWLPFVVTLLVGLFLGFQGELTLDLPGLLLGVVLCGSWLLGIGLWPLTCVYALLTLPLLFGVVGDNPDELKHLTTSEDKFVRIEGTVRSRSQITSSQPALLWVLLGDVRVYHANKETRLQELVVTLPIVSKGFVPRRRRTVLFAGDMISLQKEQGHLEASLSNAVWSHQAEQINPNGGEVLRTRLWNRAAYYLSSEAMAAYGPIVLGVRTQRSREARGVIQSFRNVGISHLLAISGLHIGLLFIILITFNHWGHGWRLRGQGYLQPRTLHRLGIMGIIWLYIALIGFPVPAVRAAVMGSMIVWGELWGTRTSRLYILGLSALILLMPDPTLVYDLSFLLSFLAYFFLIWALDTAYGIRTQFRPLITHIPTLRERFLRALGMNLWVTTSITIGLWPVIAHYFGSVSLLVFAGNLLLVPLLAMAVLPAGIIGLLVSFAFLEQVPGGWIERGVFWAVDTILTGWIGLIYLIENLGKDLVIHYSPSWPPQAFFLYYILLLAGLILYEVKIKKMNFSTLRKSP